MLYKHKQTEDNYRDKILTYGPWKALFLLWNIFLKQTQDVILFCSILLDS